MTNRLEGAPQVESLPPIRRARGFRLYDRYGRRYLDLYLDGAVAVLGHRPRRLHREIKGLLDRGGLAALPSVYVPRLEKALARAYPQFAEVRILEDLPSALSLVARHLGAGASARIADPALGEIGPIIWDRPLLPTAERTRALEQAEVVLPVLPFRLAGAPCPVLLRRRTEGPRPETPWISPMLAAAALRSFYDLQRCQSPAWYRPDLLADCPAWVQRGRYVAPRFGPELYERVFKRFLAHGVLLAPRHPGPSVLPGEASEGELALLLRLFREEV